MRRRRADGSPRSEAFDSPGRVAYVSALFVAGVLALSITPALFAGWSARFHWSDTRLGEVASVELGAFALASASALYWQKRWDWRTVALSALVVLVVANLGCLPLGDFGAICIARAAAGIGAGLLAGVFTAFLANSAAPDRVVAITTFAQILAAAVALALAASLAKRFGLGGLYALLALGPLSLIPSLGVLPRRWPTQTDPSFADATRGGDVANPLDVEKTFPDGLPFLLAFLPFSIFQAGMFSFLGTIGQTTAHLTSAQALYVLSLAAVASAAGPAAAYLLHDRAGIALTIAAAIALEIALTFGIVSGPYSMSVFFAYAASLQAGWTFLVCYLYAALVSANAPLTSGATSVSAIGSAVGSAVVGLAIDRQGLAAASLVSVFCLLGIAVCTLPFIRTRRERSAI